MNQKIHTAFFLSLVLTSAAAYAQAPAEIEIIFDASGSMNDAPRGMTKLEEAKQALSTAAAQIPAGARVGLRVFGVTPVRENIRESCTDSRLLIPIGQFDPARMQAEVAPLKSYGMTALGHSLELAAKDFSSGAGVEKTVLLISDGEETCGKDPAAVIQALKQQGIAFKIHAVGFDATDAAKSQLKQLAEMSGGTYYEAKDAGELKKALQQSVQETMLLKVQRSGDENILAAPAGTRIVTSTDQKFALAIDGNEKVSFNLTPGEEAVFSFKDDQPVLLEKFAIPVFDLNVHNPKDLYLSASVDSPSGGFIPILTARPENKVFFGNVYQEFKIDPPQPVKYLKITAGSGHNSNHSTHYEWKAYGKYLSPEEFQEAVKALPVPELNVLGQEYGGQLIAATNMKFQNVNDGKGGTPGLAADVRPGEEGIFGFEGGKTAEITKFAIPIYEANDANCKIIEFHVSETAPTGPYTKAAQLETTNMVFAGDPFQELKLETPVKAKFLKIKAAETHGAYWCSLKEVRVTGRLES